MTSTKIRGLIRADTVDLIITQMDGVCVGQRFHVLISVFMCLKVAVNYSANQTMCATTMCGEAPLCIVRMLSLSVVLN